MYNLKELSKANPTRVATVLMSILAVLSLAGVVELSSELRDAIQLAVLGLLSLFWVSGSSASDSDDEIV